VIEKRRIEDTRVAVVLVNWNGWRECVECLDTLFAQNHGNFCAFVVDNNSSDGSIDHILAWCADPRSEDGWRTDLGVSRLTGRHDIEPVETRVVGPDDLELVKGGRIGGVTLIRSDRNLGFAGGCNLGIKAGGLHNFDYFWLLNPDTVVHPDALVELIDRALDSEDIGMTGSTMLYYDAPDIVQAMGGARLNLANGGTWHIGHGLKLAEVPADGSIVEREMTYVMGASMLVSARFIAEIGPMEEDYFLYYEEVDWALRGRGKFSPGFAPRSLVFHKSGANSTKSAPLISARFYYRNRMRFVARFLPAQIWAAKRALLWVLLRQIARGQWSHARIVASVLLSAKKLAATVIPK
jgi:GT2 family glycosyltransferase